MADELLQQAREVAADVWGDIAPWSRKWILSGGCDAETWMKAVLAALRAAPEGYVLVPVERGQFYVCPTCHGPGVVTKEVHDATRAARPQVVTDEMVEAAHAAYWAHPDDSGEDRPCIRAALEAMLAARPQGAEPWPDIDGCTESNCRRCRTHPAHRGDMEHAGIGWRPGRPQEPRND